MKLTIEGDTKEIATLVLELQERRFDEETASKIIAHLQEQQSQNKQIWQPSVDYTEYFPESFTSKKSESSGYPSLSENIPIAAHVFLHVGEILLAISLADFFLCKLPKIIEAFFAG